MKKVILALGAFLVGISAQVVSAEEVGFVVTSHNIIGSNDKVVVEVFEDTSVSGVACYLSHAIAGGLSTEDKTEASIACRKIGTISVKGKLPRQEDVFSTKMSFIFKYLHVVRIVDPKRNVLVYLTYSTDGPDGSPKNSVTAIPVGRDTQLQVQ